MIGDIKELKVAVPYSLILGVIVGFFSLLLPMMLPESSGSEGNESNSDENKRTKNWKQSLWLGSAAAYMTLVIYRCFLNRDPSSYGTVDLRLWTTVESVSGYHYFIDNILLFVPCGALLLIVTRSMWQSVVIGIGMSLTIEVLQVLTGLGVFHLDDLVANSIGAIIGVAIATLFLFVVRGIRMRE